MKRGFVRFVWGDCSSNGLRDGKLFKDIRASQAKESFVFVVYVLGQDNYQTLSQMGFSCVLIDKNPLLYDIEHQQWAHKLYMLNYAIEDYDEMIYLDWDCLAVSQGSPDVWESLGKKQIFQANLFQYRTKKCLWRDDEMRKVCNGGFLYMRDRSIPEKIIMNYNKLFEWAMEQQEKRRAGGKELRLREKCLIIDDEPAMSKYVDDLMDGWKGVDYYWDHFEPDVCNIKKKSAYGQERLETKENVCFVHSV